MEENNENKKVLICGMGPDINRNEIKEELVKEINDNEKSSKIKSNYFTDLMYNTIINTLYDDKFMNQIKRESKRKSKIRHFTYADRDQESQSIRQGRCPVCNSRLKRGKKDKHNGNKRVWECTICNKQFTL